MSNGTNGLRSTWWPGLPVAILRAVSPAEAPSGGAPPGWCSSWRAASCQAVRVSGVGASVRGTPVPAAAWASRTNRPDGPKASAAAG